MAQRSRDGRCVIQSREKVVTGDLDALIGSLHPQGDFAQRGQPTLLSPKCAAEAPTV